MVRMFVRHPVEDFTHWKQAYDAFDRESLGVTGHGVYQSVSDPNDVTVWHDFDDIDAARAMAESDELRTAMGEAGVAGAPDIWFTEPA